MKRTTIWLEERDREAIRVIRERYGLSTDANAIRFAVRILAESPHVQIPDAESWLKTNDGEEAE